jgi:hypothetical protein
MARIAITITLRTGYMVENYTTKDNISDRACAVVVLISIFKDFFFQT